MRKGQAILALLSDRPVAYHPDVARIVGGVKAAVFLCQLLYWTGREARTDGFIWKTQAEMEQETALTRHEQDGARKRLRGLGIIEEKRAGIPAKLHYRVDTDKLLESIDRFYSKQDCHFSANCTDGNRQTITEITPETTSEDIDVRTSIAGDDAKQEAAPTQPRAGKIQQRKRTESKRENGSQPGLPGLPTLQIETPQEQLLFDAINVQRRAGNRRRLTKFPTLAVKERYAATAAALDNGNGELESAIQKTFQAGITAVPKVVAYLGGIVKGKDRDAATHRGEVYTADSGGKVLKINEW
ncbi:MAG: hypothetical protein GY832_26055 [Chloroflexi bacterium]|nr:hypothetical protein [Chloroflexota bacterium]